MKLNICVKRHKNSGSGRNARDEADKKSNINSQILLQQKKMKNGETSSRKLGMQEKKSL